MGFRFRGILGGGVIVKDLMVDFVILLNVFFIKCGCSRFGVDREGGIGGKFPGGVSAVVDRGCTKSFASGGMRVVLSSSVGRFRRGRRGKIASGPFCLFC